MREIPLLFSGQMVGELLAGRKTQTRRVAAKTILPGDRIWVRESCWIYGEWHPNGLNKRGGQRWTFEVIGQDVIFESPGYEKVAHWGGGRGWGHRPSIHMPRWASRLTLEVSDVRVEWLHNISEEDALAEGITEDRVIIGAHANGGRHTEVHASRYFRPGCDDDYETAVGAFSDLWASINGQESWNSNPLVQALTFSVVQS